MFNFKQRRLLRAHSLAMAIIEASTKVLADFLEHKEAWRVADGLYQAFADAAGNDKQSFFDMDSVCGALDNYRFCLSVKDMTLDLLPMCNTYEECCFILYHAVMVNLKVTKDQPREPTVEEMALTIAPE